MSSIIISNPNISDNIRTNLSQDYSSGTTLNVDSSTSFKSGNYILVGELGLEKTELTNLTASPPTSTSITVSALSYSHPAGTPIFYLNWDKFELSYRTSSTGTWTVYGSMPANLAYDSLSTEYRDTSATSTYQWRYRYYSTENSAYSDYSDVIGTTGWSRKSVGYMVREIRKIVNDPESKTVSDTEIIRFLNAAQDKVFTLYDRWWFLEKVGTSIPTVVGQKTYPLPSDFGRMHLVAFQYVNGSNDITYNLREISNIEYDYETRDNNAANNDDIKYYSIYPGDSTSPTGYIKIWPKPYTAALNIIPRYYKNMTDLSTYSDTTDIPVPDLLENYAISKILGIRKEDDKAAEYDSMFKEQIELLKLMQRKNARPMRVLWKFKGVKPEERMFGTRNVYSDITKEQNF